MTHLLSFLYCFIGSLWACYWLEELCFGIYLDRRMWFYAWRMAVQILIWPIVATAHLRGLAFDDHWTHFPDSSHPKVARVILIVFGVVGFAILCVGVRHLI